MTQVIEYAVRVKGTQKYLPRSQRRDGRGGSWLEPADFSLPKGERLPEHQQRYEDGLQIRSYATRKAAQNLLTAWCMGKFTGDWDGYVEKRKGTERDPNKLEIVELVVTLPA